PGSALPLGTPVRAHKRDRALRTLQKTPCPASRGRRVVPFAVARSHPKATCRGARKALAAWGDIRTAPEYLPGIVLPGSRRAFSIPGSRLRAPEQKPRHTPHRDLLPVRAPPGRVLSPDPNFRNALRTLPPRPGKWRPSRYLRPDAPVRWYAATGFL